MIISAALIIFGIAMLLFGVYRVIEGALVCDVMFGGMAGIADCRKREGEQE